MACIVGTVNTKQQRRAHPAHGPLAELGLLDGLAPDRVDELLANADVVDLPAGDVIDRAGTPARQFLAVLDGYVECVPGRGDEWERPTVVGPGAWIGAAEVLVASDHAATYIARSAVSVVVVFGPAFRAVFRDVPGIAARASAPIAVIPELTPVG